MLAYDILQLAGLLFLTGGVANPFVILLLAPVTIAATSLSLRHALALLGLALVCATVLLRVSLPLPWIGGESLVLPPLYVVARWVALAVSAAFVALYAYRVAEEARQTRERADGGRARSRPRPASVPDRRPRGGGGA